MAGAELTDQGYWDRYYETADVAHLEVGDDTLPFHDVFDRHFRRDPSR